MAKLICGLPVQRAVEDVVAHDLLDQRRVLFDTAGEFTDQASERAHKLPSVVENGGTGYRRLMSPAKRCQPAFALQRMEYQNGGFSRPTPQCTIGDL